MSTEVSNNNSQLSQEATPREGTRGGRFYRPSVDIVETKEELLLKCDMPGTSAEHISLAYENGALTLHGAVPARQPKDMTYLLQEYGIGDFHREFQVNEAIDSSRISAEYTNGVLVVRLPKAEAAKPRKIEVRNI
ncbi:MAG: Hsp20/alpha crystallin family protein [Deltaproteobacteria bacterium]|nr:Hsp20/alpha crystallin family protein [Deltaproteobacteria bacterium]